MEKENSGLGVIGRFLRIVIVMNEYAMVHVYQTAQQRLDYLNNCRDVNVNVYLNIEILAIMIIITEFTLQFRYIKEPLNSNATFSSLTLSWRK